MFPKWWQKRSKKRPARTWTFQAQLEELEARRLFTVRVWSGLGADPFWSIDANWVGNARPVPGDDLEFPVGALRLTNNNDFPSGMAFNSLTFTGGGYVLDGFQIELGGGGVRSSGFFFVPNVIRIPLILPVTQTVMVEFSSLDLAGPIEGKGGLTKEGNGQLFLTGSVPNTYEGATTVNAGSLLLRKSPGVTAVAGELVVGDDQGGFFSDSVRVMDSEQIADDASVSIRGTGQLTLDGFYASSFTETIGSLTMTGGSLGTFGQGLVLRLAGDVTASSDNPLFPTRISGTLDLGAATRTFTILAGGPGEGLIINAIIRGDVGAGIVKAGPGTLAFEGFNDNTYTGPTRVNDGTLVLGGFSPIRVIPGALIIGDGEGEPGSDRVRIARDNPIADNAPVTINSSGQLEFSGLYSSSFSDTIGSLTMNGGAMVTTNDGTLRLGGNVTAMRLAGRNPTISGNLSLGGATRIFTVGGTFLDQLTLDATVTGDGAAGIIKAGAGNLRMTGPRANTYVGATQVREGTLELAKNGGITAIAGPLVVGDGVGALESDRVRITARDQIADDVDVTITSSGRLEMQGVYADFSDTIGSLTMTSGSVVTNTNTLGLSGGITALPAAVSSLITGNLMLTAGAHAVNVADGAAPLDLQINANVRGPGGLTKQGAGTLELAGSNTFTGNTNVDAGTMLVNAGTADTTIFVNAGGTLAGTGRVGFVSVRGTLSPGRNMPGMLRTGPVGFTVGSTFRVELNGPTPGDGYDQIIATGPVEGGGGTLTATLGFPATVGQQFRIVSTTNQRPSTFANLPEGAVFAISGKPFRINYDLQGVLLTRVQGATSTAVVSSVNPSVYGQAVTFRATVRSTVPGVGPVTGEVAFFDGQTLLGGAQLNAAGEATITTTVPLPAGARTIRAVYSGSPDFEGSTGTLVQNVQQAATAVAAPISFANPAVFGQQISFLTFVAAVAPGAGTPTGTVTFRAGDVELGTVPLVGGFAVFTTTAGVVGTFDVTAEYNGDANFLGGLSDVTEQVINPADTRTFLLTSENPSQVGQPITFTTLTTVQAPGAGTPTGSVYFFDGDELIGVEAVDENGVATLRTADLAEGDHLIVAYYEGDENNNASVAYLVQTVLPGRSPGGGGVPDAVAVLQPTRAAPVPVSPAQRPAGAEPASLEGLAQRYYHKTLGRAPEPAEVQDWLARLRRGETNEDEIVALIEPREDLTEPL